MPSYPWYPSPYYPSYPPYRDTTIVWCGTEGESQK